MFFWTLVALDIRKSALSLVIHKEGRVLIDDINELLERYRLRGIEIDRAEYIQAIKDSAEYYFSDRARLMICTDGACAKRSYVEHSEASLFEISRNLSCPVLLTGCHWRCEDGPVLALKVGAKNHSYLHCENDSSYLQAQEAMKKILAIDVEKLAKRSKKSVLEED